MSALNRMWYEGRWYQWLLLPFTLLFFLLSALRRLFFRLGIKKVVTLPVPVIVVGNLSVGGNGKTPLVVALCEKLQRAGYKVGVVSRGYGAKTTEFPHQVSANDSAPMVGDEPLLTIARRRTTANHEKFKIKFCRNKNLRIDIALMIFSSED